MAPHLIFVKSSDRDLNKYKDASSYVIHLPVTYKSVFQVRLASLEIPISMYSFRSSIGNTSFTITVEGHPTKTFFISDGNYDLNSITASMELALNTDPDFMNAEVIFFLVVSPATLKCTITNTANLSMTLDTRATSDDPKYWGLARYLGFVNKNSTYVGTTIVSESMVCVNPNLYMILDIDELNVIDDVQRGAKTAFAKIQLNGRANDIIMYKLADFCDCGDTRLSPALGKMDRLTITWRYQNGTPIDFNGIEHSFTLMVDTLQGAPAYLGETPPQSVLVQGSPEECCT
jgi:hypothetical protein